MNSILKFIKNRSVLFWIVAVQFALFVSISVMVDFQPETIASWFEVFANSPFAIPAIILIYTIAAFVNAPQWMLHTGVVLTFGPIYGGAIAWFASMVSASFDFWLGRRMGAERIDRLSGGFVAKFLHLVKDHGFWASLAVRIIPTGPFILVNLAAGVTRMKFTSFLLGTGIGIIPKIALVGSISEGVKGSVNGKGPLYIAIVVGIALAWIGIIYWVGSRLKRKALLRKEKRNQIEPPQET